MDLLIRTLLDLTGTAVFAITGALAAGRKSMDIFGVIVLGCVTAIGGGTLRDLILGLHSVFWVTQTHYLMISALAAAATFFIAQRWQIPEKALLYADAIGLAVFSVIGFQAGFQATRSYGIGIIMGVMTSVAGGMIRDVLSGEIPLILRREVYASASLCGAALYALLVYFGIASPLAALVAVVVTLVIRITALEMRLGLPRLRLRPAPPGSHRDER